MHHPAATDRMQIFALFLIMLYNVSATRRGTYWTGLREANFHMNARPADGLWVKAIDDAPVLSAALNAPT